MRLSRVVGAFVVLLVVAGVVLGILSGFFTQVGQFGSDLLGPRSQVSGGPGGQGADPSKLPTRPIHRPCDPVRPPRPVPAAVLHLVPGDAVPDDADPDPRRLARRRIRSAGAGARRGRREGRRRPGQGAGADRRRRPGAGSRRGRGRGRYRQGRLHRQRQAPLHPGVDQQAVDLGRRPPVVRTRAPVPDQGRGRQGQARSCWSVAATRTWCRPSPARTVPDGRR